MKKANATTKEQENGTVEYTVASLERSKAYLKFPIDVTNRKLQENMRNLENMERDYQSNVDHYRNSLVEMEGSLRNTKLKLYKAQKELPAEAAATLDEIKALLDEAAALPWVQKVSVDGSSLRVITRPNSLYTTFDVRVVDCGGGFREREFMEPITAALPQYEVLINLSVLSERLGNNRNRLAIRLHDQNDVVSFIGGKVTRHDVHAHWGSSGGQNFGDWEQLCFGEHEDYITKASAKSIVTLLNELAMYLQISGDDGNAYRTKDAWALELGKKEYNAFNLRVIGKGETRGLLQEKWREDYKKFRQPPPENNRLVTNTRITDNHGARRRARRAGQFQAQGIEATGTTLDAVERMYADMIRTRNPGLITPMPIIQTWTTNAFINDDGHNHIGPTANTTAQNFTGLDTLPFEDEQIDPPEL